jgi:hypothetical protein
MKTTADNDSTEQIIHDCRQSMVRMFIFGGMILFVYGRALAAFG